MIMPAWASQKHQLLQFSQNSLYLFKQESRAVAGNPRDAAVIFDP